MAIVSINPATGETLQVFEPFSEPAIEQKLARAWEAFHQWKATPFSVRAKALLQAAEILESEKQAFGSLMTREMGKTIGSGVVPNTPENMLSWVTDPNDIKPGTLMPAMHLTSVQNRQLVAYLMTLH